MISPNIFDVTFIWKLAKQAVVRYKRYREYNRVNSIIIKFFNFTTRCPEGLRDCESLRNEFLMEVERHKKYKVCSTCDIQYIRLKFINRIKQMLNYE